MYCSVNKSCLTLCDPMDCSMLGFPVLPYFLECDQTHVDRVVMPANHLMLCLPLLLLSSVFPSIRVISNDLAFHISWPNCGSFSFAISPSNAYSGLIFFRINWLLCLQFKGLSRVFSNTKVQKHQFFGTQRSLWSNSYIHTLLLGKPQLWLILMFVGSKEMSLFFNIVSRFAIAFLPRSEHQSLDGTKKY